MIPGLFPAIPYFWLPLMSTPQTALGGTSYTVPCGRVVGGGSMVNAMFMSRGSAVEYDTWAQLGATGWTWRDLLPYFRKVRSSFHFLLMRCTSRANVQSQSETFNRPDPIYAAEHNITWDDSVHGFQGPVPVTIAPYDYPGSGKGSLVQ